MCRGKPKLNFSIVYTLYYNVQTSCDASGKVLVNSTFEKDHREKPWTESQNKSVWICERGWLVEYGWIHSIDFIDQGRYTSGLETFLSFDHAHAHEE